MPIDGSGTTRFGLSEPIRLAKNQGARIKPVRMAIDWIVVLPEAYINIGRFVDSLRSSVKTILANGEAAVRGAGVEVDTTLVEAMGNAPDDQIIQLAKGGNRFHICWRHGRRGGFG